MDRGWKNTPPSPCEAPRTPATARVSPAPANRRRLNANHHPVIRLQLDKPPPSPLLPSPDISPLSSPNRPRRNHHHHPLPPQTAPPTTTTYVLTPPRPRSHASHPCPYPTPSTPSPLRPRALALAHLPSRSSLASSSTNPSTPSTPSRRPSHARSPSLTLILPAPVRPSLAMSLSPTSLHHTPSKPPHAPTPIHRPSHAHSHSLGAGPAPAPAPVDLEFLRPPSRSQRLLRETLRRDSQHQSGRAVSLSPRARMRRAESYSHPAPPYGDMFDCCIDDDDDDDGVDEEDNDGPLLFATQKRAPPLRRASKSAVDAPRGRSPATDEKRGESSTNSSALPSPARSASALPPALSRASSTRSRPRHHTHPSTQHGLAPPAPASPRSTLAHLQAQSPGLGAQEPRAHPLGLGQTQIQSPSPSQNPSPEPRRPTHTPHLSSSSSSSSASSTPGTPPPASAAFDAHLASAKLRHTDGYVSFAAVEGLGAPPGEGEESAEEERRGWLWRWKSG